MTGGRSLDPCLPRRRSAWSAALKAHLIACLGIIGIARADLIAHVQTDLGTINVVLHYDKAPQAVANFIVLAEGTRDRLDTETGALSRSPFYLGETFYRTANNDSFKFAQTGSGNGTNSGGGPGYTFKDEFDPSLNHTGYTLSMANSGPNTNGSQIFFTGNVSIPSYDGVHTVLGTVIDSASQTVVDNVIAAGDDGSTITGITFSRSGDALNFDEHAQNLPLVYQPNGKLTIFPGTLSRFDLLPSASTGDVVTAYRSTDLSSWTRVASIHIGITPALLTPALPSIELDDASAPNAYFHRAIAHHYDSVSISHLRARTITLPISSGTFTFAFDNSGVTGTTTFTPGDGSTPITSPLALVDFISGAHHFFAITDSPGLTTRYLLLRVGCDSTTNTTISCHHRSDTWWLGGWAPYASGSCTVDR